MLWQIPVWMYVNATLLRSRCTPLNILLLSIDMCSHPHFCITLLQVDSSPHTPAWGGQPTVQPVARLDEQQCQFRAAHVRLAVAFADTLVW
jgi:hypothetical protein